MNGLFFDIFNKYKTAVKHIVTNRSDSNLGNNFGLNTPDEPTNVYENRNQLKTFLNADYLIFPTQTHSATVITVDDRILTTTNAPECDALVTNLPNVAIAVTTADCVPLLLYDAKNKAVGVVHAGLKGTVSNITIETINQMNANFGTEPKDILVGIGPCISVKNYEIGNDIWENISQTENRIFLYPHSNPEKRYFDLVACNISQLLNLGVKMENIESSNICTFDSYEDYFSYRKDKNTGRMASVMMLVK